MEANTAGEQGGGGRKRRNLRPATIFAVALLFAALVYTSFDDSLAHDSFPPSGIVAGPSSATPEPAEASEQPRDSALDGAPAGTDTAMGGGGGGGAAPWFSNPANNETILGAAAGGGNATDDTPSFMAMSSLLARANATVGTRALKGKCRLVSAPERGPQGHLIVDAGPARALAAGGIDCPILWGDTVRVCGRKLAGGRLVNGPKKSPREALIPALKKKDRATVFKLLDGACEWPNVNGKYDDSFSEGEEARTLIGSMQHGYDCAPSDASGIATTAHHTEAHSARPLASYNLYQRLVLEHQLPAPIPSGEATIDVPFMKGTHPPGVPSQPESVPLGKVAYRAAVFPGKTSYSRPNKARFIRVDNVCMTCERKGQWFMNGARPCHTTLWSVGELTLGLESKARKGRHGIFKEREGGFQFGGRLASSPKNVLVVRGTTFFTTNFANDNVGHVIRDAAWMSHVASHVRHLAGFPKPHHAMVDRDLWNYSSPYYAFLTTVAALRNLGGDGENIDHRTLNRPRDGSNSPPLLLDPLSSGEERMVCFETGVFSGRDRLGYNNGKLIGRPDAAAAMRKEMLSFLNVDPTIIDGSRVRPPRVYIYGRQDVYRRRLDNIGALTAALHDVTQSLGAPPPTVITTFYMEPGRQIELMAGIDVLVSIQGAHLEQHIFMPQDAVILEIAQCTSKRTSFISRYGAYHPRQTFKQMSVCTPKINFSDKDKRAQDLLLCPHHLRQLQRDVHEALMKMMKARGVPFTVATEQQHRRSLVAASDVTSNTTASASSDDAPADKENF